MKNYLAYAGLAAALLAILAWHGVWQLVAFGALCVLLPLLFHDSLSHPLAWFPPIFGLYTLAFPALAVLGVYQFNADVALTLRYHALAMGAFAVGVGMRSTPLERCGLGVGFDGLLAKWVALLLVPLALLLLYRVAASGVTSKRELVDNASWEVALLLSALLLMSVYAAVHFAATWLKGESAFLTAFGLGTLFFLVILYTGERDYLLRFALVSVLMFWDIHRRPGAKAMVAMGLAVVALLPLLQGLKAVGLGAQFGYTFESLAVVSQEFRSMAQNTYLTLAYDLPELLVPGQALLWDLKRTLATDLFGLESMGTGRWYNEVILSDIVSGRGFSLVSVGLLSGGWIGVIAIYAVGGRMIRYFYERRGRSLYAFVTYFMLVPAWIYGQRGDLSAFLAPLIKHILLPLLLLWVLREVMLFSAKRVASAAERRAYPRPAAKLA